MTSFKLVQVKLWFQGVCELSFMNRSENEIVCLRKAGCERILSLSNTDFVLICFMRRRFLRACPRFGL